jgi:hypothetical protein
MKVLNICCDDYANFAHDNAKSLRAVGVNCIDVKLRPHVFGYESQSRIVNEIELKNEIHSADLVQIFHSDNSLLKYCTGKRIVVYHTGTRYRQSPAKFNALFNPFVEISFIALGEFAGLGAKNERYIVGAVAIPDIAINYLQGQLKYAHYPSNALVKNSDNILFVMSTKTNDCIFKYSATNVPYKEQLQRMSECNVYIEMNSLYQDGKQYGSWGITALEATAMGKIVITNHSSVAVYEKEYGVKPSLLLIEKAFDGLGGIVDYLNSLDSSELGKLAIESYEWVCKYHSYKATGEKLKQILSL